MKIFIVSSLEAADKDTLLKIAGILRNAGAEPIPWNTTPSIFMAGKTTIENLEEIVTREHIKASVFIYSEDDKTWHRGNMQNVPRDNVVFEHGLFTGILGRTKAITIKVGNVKIPSDLHGLTCIDYGKSPEDATLDIKQWVKGLLNLEQDNNCENERNCDMNKINQEIIQEKEVSSIKRENSLVELVSIQHGTYNRIKDNQKITIDKSFSISKKLITQAIYNSVMGNNPSHFEGDNLPVENISFREAIIFCNKLSVKEGYQEIYTITDDLILWNEKAKGYRLPFEIEWECALGYNNNREITDNLNKLAWYSDNSEYKTHDVGQKSENSFGIYDLLGNVWEWCFDSKDDGQLRVLRGGSFADFRAQFTTQGFKKEKNENSSSKDVGFRVIL